MTIVAPVKTTTTTTAAAVEHSASPVRSLTDTEDTSRLVRATQSRKATSVPPKPVVPSLIAPGNSWHTAASSALFPTKNLNEPYDGSLSTWPMPSPTLASTAFVIEDLGRGQETSTTSNTVESALATEGPTRSSFQKKLGKDVNGRLASPVTVTKSWEWSGLQETTPSPEDLQSTKKALPTPTDLSRPRLLESLSNSPLIDFPNNSESLPIGNLLPSQLPEPVNGIIPSIPPLVPSPSSDPVTPPTDVPKIPSPAANPPSVPNGPTTSITSGPTLPIPSLQPDLPPLENKPGVLQPPRSGLVSAPRPAAADSGNGGDLLGGPPLLPPTAGSPSLGAVPDNAGVVNGNDGKGKDGSGIKGGDRPGTTDTTRKLDAERTGTWHPSVGVIFGVALVFFIGLAAAVKYRKRRRPQRLTDRESSVSGNGTRKEDVTIIRPKPPPLEPVHAMIAVPAPPPTLPLQLDAFAPALAPIASVEQPKYLSERGDTAPEFSTLASDENHVLCKPAPVVDVSNIKPAPLPSYPTSILSESTGRDADSIQDSLSLRPDAYLVLSPSGAVYETDEGTLETGQNASRASVQRSSASSSDYSNLSIALHAMQQPTNQSYPSRSLERGRPRGLSTSTFATSVTSVWETDTEYSLDYESIGDGRSDRRTSDVEMCEYQEIDSETESIASGSVVQVVVEARRCSS
ncbi:uncharacterized protein SPPG_00157 [Spizellomyces punctatus DAOM BR117]|uniref:Uncharacterized protein n=1 Tax=Spizellomyces punctatus (strain DAOM BR117) TaxID=645134 RepID=A0A0L0HTI6_SPIPD|nr:uncharacterized protein SPPG_00157 [Spizellomyces punctatus DAOM BR117]KND04428.1 hypothetical protein SPPG_00157 [Spizellomyces punctatus DAOM BR117]|eukprot:XP_016612467.1 hypothetical protein SPPG_00157 [Spizellomyces punctatus DAOM BR117]